MIIHLKQLTRWILILFFLTIVHTNAYSQLQSLCISGTKDDHEYVDLGLPSHKEWAIENLSFEFGDKFDAGDRLAVCWTKDPETRFKNPWKEPSKEDFEELIENCTWEWTTYNGKEGVKGTGPNGNYIFFPANFESANIRVGRYWTRTHSPKFGIEFYAIFFSPLNCVPYLYCDKGDKIMNVRPVF